MKVRKCDKIIQILLLYFSLRTVRVAMKIDNAPLASSRLSPVFLFTHKNKPTLLTQLFNTSKVKKHHLNTSTNTMANNGGRQGGGGNQNMNEHVEFTVKVRNIFVVKAERGRLKADDGLIEIQINGARLWDAAAGSEMLF